MTLLLNRDMTDIAFYYWINGFPTSNHQLDRSRFLGFILTARRFRCKRYSTFTKFKNECLAYLDNLTETDIEGFWNEKQIVEDFLDELETADIPPQRVLINSVDGPRFIQQNIINHQLYRTLISEKEYDNGGLSHAEVKRRVKK